MTLPEEIKIGVNKEEILSEDRNELVEYFQELTREIEDMYEDLAREINGDIESFDPQIKGTSTEGTYTYDHQVGWYLRRNLLVDYWFDVKWSAISSAPSGDLYVQLPYQVFDAQQKPFVGVVQTSTLSYGASASYQVLNAIPGTFRCELWECGSGITTSKVNANVSAGQLIGHIRYVGTEND